VLLSPLSPLAPAPKHIHKERIIPNTSLRVLYEIGGDSGDGGDGGDSFEIAGLFLSPLNVQVVTVVT
jgi:hypothetical protein